jgi:hypothetical protein
MIDYLKGVLEDFPEIIVRMATSPAADHLFTVRPDDDMKLLDEPHTLAFHLGGTTIVHQNYSKERHPNHRCLHHNAQERVRHG